jgi:hypothetical protein
VTGIFTTQSGTACYSNSRKYCPIDWWVSHETRDTQRMYIQAWWQIEQDRIFGNRDMHKPVRISSEQKREWRRIPG